MDEKTLKPLLDAEEAKNLVMRKAYYSKLLGDEKLTTEQKIIVNDYLDEIEQRLENVDETNRFNNPTHIASINVIDDVVQKLKATII